MFYRWYLSLNLASCKQQRQGGRAAKVKEREMGISADRLWFWAISQHVSFLLWVFFFRCSKRLRGAKPHAVERSEKVRRLLASLVSNSKVLYGNSVKRFSLVLQVPCRQHLELDERLR